MPHCFQDCVLIPVPKKHKDVTCSSSYCPIALAPSLNKTLEHLILIKYSTFLHTSPLQFGFKPGSSTTLCTGVVKNIISRYIHRGSSVYGVFLMLVKHLILSITVFCFKNSLIVVYLFLLFASCHHGTALK